MPGTDPIDTPPRRAWVRATLAAALLASTRAGLVALQLRATAGELDRVTRGIALDHLVWGALVSFPVLLLLCLGAWRLRLLARLALGLGALFLGFLFVTLRLPAFPSYVPELESSRGTAANALAAACALAAALVALARARRLAPRALGAAALALLACAAAYVTFLAGPRAAWPARPNVILISLDTLRADHLGCYGYERDTSPALDAFAAGALRFESAFAASSWTLTSHMSLLTSLSPIAHGVDRDRGLPPGVDTLATHLSGAGYFTAAVLDACPWIGARFGFDRGFHVARRTGHGADVKIDRVLEVLDDAGDRPFFLFAHFFDVHSDATRLPYDSADEDRARFASDYAGDFTGCGDEGTCASQWMMELNRRGVELGEEDRRYVTALYDAGIRTLDRALARLFDELERRGLLATSVVILVADHGEELQDHGRLLHGQLFGECLRVPLIVRTPDTTGGASSELASLLDVMPTVLELCGEEPLGPQGVSLAPLLRGDALAAPRAYVTAETDGALRVLRTPRWVLHRTDEAWLLFDALADPGEEHDLIAAGAPPPELDELKALWERVTADAEALRAEHAADAERLELSAEQRRTLSGIGYGGGEEEY